MLADRNAKSFEFKEVPKELADFLLKADVAAVRQGLLDGRFTSVDLVNFYGARTQRLGRDLCLTAEELFAPAMELAEKCDAERQASKDLPYLHGIPVSIKEQFVMEGTTTTIGCAMNTEVSTRTAEALTPILEAGAIPLVRGNLPQGALSGHSINYIWGEA